ncbi:RelA/SpoT domain-containing protein [Marinilongibacter aquaticus]|uniref:RelA/SpoT domain-containing protein n=1 Tax=Marinilongibacter aquaticus TaxID=2975157 RepID=UPI0021BDAADB|nr:RelA/SpoT domain-containing protein [Marinilongibacter aquaticus]UBM60766.1 RelA/SpoT domain-containing protein [Marinilongibacter aquaticus]
MSRDLQLIEKDICSKICDRLDKVGLLYRIFSRVKDSNSIAEKIERKKAEGEPYSKDGKKMQDIIGVRIVTYFHDDVNLVREILSDVYKCVDEEIDKVEPTVFKPKRTNIICSFDEKQKGTFNEVAKVTNRESLQLTDHTFELQLRTILSEGWHEIDHSLRYKSKDEWKNHSEKERLLNGIYANLEVNDLAMKSLFSELAYQHFKEKNWEGMLRNRYRLKFQLFKLKEELKHILNEHPKVAKQLFKVDRHDVISKLSKLEFSLPINFNNMVYFINHIELKNEDIANLTPDLIKNCL